MSTQTRAIYHDRKPYLNDALPFPSGTSVVIIIEDANVDATPRVRGKAHSVLVQADLVKSSPVPSPSRSTLSPERAAELSELSAQDGPMSSLIIEERDGH